MLIAVLPDYGHIHTLMINGEIPELQAPGDNKKNR
jgi:hypothetical protein